MNEPHLTGRTDECGADVSPFALNALEPAEADAFRRHLETCVVCRDELASFQQVVDILPISASQHGAPKALRRRVLAEVRREVARREKEHRLDSPRPLRSFVGPRLRLALGVGLAVVLIAAGGAKLVSSRAGHTQVFSAQVAGSSGSAEVRVADGHAELVVHDLEPPPAGEIYEVWLARSHRKPQPTNALFSVTARGDGAVDVPGNLQGIQQVTVTPEPDGGRRVPTHPVVITAELT